MEAVQFASYGGPEVLEVVEAEEPHASAGEVRIAVRAAGVQQVDAKIRAGYLQDFMPVQLPATSGSDAAGVVDQVGAGVDGVAVGDRVFGNGREAYAEHAVLTAWAFMPNEMSFEEAAGYPGSVETAVRILDDIGVQPGQLLLVSGASGGAGSAVLQFARGRGIKVIATASAANQDYLRSLGATPTTYGEGLVDRVRQLAPDGIAGALDLAGSGVLAELVELTGDPGKVLTIADLASAAHGVRFSREHGDSAAAYAEAVRLFQEGRFTIPVEATYPLERAGEAQARSAAGHARGRLVLTVGSAVRTASSSSSTPQPRLRSSLPPFLQAATP